MVGAAQSRKLVARVGWSAASTDEEARTYLQERLMVLSALMFWSFVVFLGGLRLMYWRYSDYEPRHNNIIFMASSVGLLLLAGIWRLWLKRGRLSMTTLHRIDAFYAIGTGILFALGGSLSTDFTPAPYACLLYACLTVLSRAIVVPSSPNRTLVMATLAFTPFAIASVIVATTDMGKLGIPEPALVLSVLVIAASTAALAAVGSKTTYDLRRTVSTTMQLGQYTLERVIGRGGMGTVYIAHHRLLRRPTAIKLLHPDRVGAASIDRFEDEVRAMSQLTHPNTVAVFDYGRSPDGIFYYAMEYLDGINLEQLVLRYGKQPATRVAQILAQVCGALQEAHGLEEAIVHRDIKPGNIILCERGGRPDVAKVVDFGLVQPIDKAATLEGTPGYIAPETTKGERVGTEADIYALGAVGFYLLSGRRVFAGSGLALCMKHVIETPPDVGNEPGVPPELARLIMSCLSKVPADRPTAEHLERELRRTVGADWTDADARTWWAEFRERQVMTPSTDDTTLTVTISLDDRKPPTEA